MLLLNLLIPFYILSSGFQPREWFPNSGQDFSLIDWDTVCPACVLRGTASC